MHTTSGAHERKTITVSTFDTISTFMLDHVPAEKAVT